MRHNLLDLIRCPACSEGNLIVQQASEQMITYGDQAVCEIEHGMVACQTCAATYPIEDYVLSFAGRLSADVRADGDYWGKFYCHMYDHGAMGLFDTRVPQAPFLGMGVSQTIPLDGEESGGAHRGLSQHRWVRQGGRVVDVGVGSGWSSLYLARQGFEVIAFDPALALMQLAKRYAISQGVCLEYVCSDMASFHLPHESVDAVFGFHSLHHIPDLEGGIRQISIMLKQGGCLALDDHLQDVTLLNQLQYSLLQEAGEHIFPPLRDPTLEHAMFSVPSENEGVGMGQLLPTIERYLHIDEVSYRPIALDTVGPLFYLEQGCELEALRYGLRVTDLIYRAMRRAWPNMMEYVTLVAQKRAELPAASQLDSIPRDQNVVLQEQIRTHERELQRLHTVIAEKNTHILYLEQLLSRIQNGRLIRLLQWLTRS